MKVKLSKEEFQTHVNAVHNRIAFFMANHLAQQAQALPPTEARDIALAKLAVSE